MVSNRTYILFTFGIFFLILSQIIAEKINDIEEDEDEEEEEFEPELARRPKQQQVQPPRGGNVQYVDGKRLNCPLCDSSVYSYCSDKLLHDACCCLNPSETDDLPYQCSVADCSFLHANTCKEHRLITACCCTQRL